jgi:predicted transcriptional regulator
MYFPNMVWIRLLAYLHSGESINVTQIARKLDITYSKCIQDLNELEKWDIVTKKYIKRGHFYSITKKGELLGKGADVITRFAEQGKVLQA